MTIRMGMITPMVTIIITMMRTVMITIMGTRMITATIIHMITGLAMIIITIPIRMPTIRMVHARWKRRRSEA
jgi:hypothetical protein